MAGRCRSLLTRADDTTRAERDVETADNEGEVEVDDDEDKDNIEFVLPVDDDVNGTAAVVGDAFDDVAHDSIRCTTC